MNICVIFGGASTEHDVSVLTALFVTNALKGHAVHPVCVGRDGRWRTGRFVRVSDLEEMRECVLLPGGTLCGLRGKRIRPIAALDCAVNCCHGGPGENGDLAGMFAALGVPLTSSEAFGARASMNKALTKRLLPAEIRRVPGISLSRGDAAGLARALSLGLPLVVKPASGGSSIGVSVCRSEKELSAALELAFTLDEEAVVERYLPAFKEVNCACYARGGEIVCSRLESPGHRADILSFAEKYLNFSKQAGDREFPAVLTTEAETEILETTRRVYRDFGLRGIVRMDYLVTPEGEVFFNEINSVPGSLAFYLFERDFSEILEEVIGEAVGRFRREQELVRSFSSDLLKGSCGGAKALKK